MTAPAPCFESPVLVTGGSGFLGRNLVNRLLSHGCTVHSLDLQPSPIQHPNLHQFVGDISDESLVWEALKGTKVVFHTAARISILRLARPSVRKSVFNTNVEATRMLLRLSKAAGVRSFIYTSSHNVCMDREIEQGSENEMYAQKFQDLYTETKILAERSVLESNDSNLNTIALRPGGIWGRGTESMMVGLFVDSLRKGRLLSTFGNLNSKTDFTHVDNLIDAQILAANALQYAQSTCSGKAYFINDDEPANQQTWFKPLVARLGYSFPKINLPESLIWVFAFISEIIHFFGGPFPILTRSAVWKSNRNFNFSIDAARKELGYTPRIDFETGLQRTLEDIEKMLQAKAVEDSSSQTAQLM